MEPLTEDLVFAAGRAILLLEEKITMTVTKDGIEIKFPPTRKISEYMAVPHYYILPYFASMEAAGLLTRVERVGISTTPKGSKKLFSGMTKEEIHIAETILDKDLFSALLNHL